MKQAAKESFEKTIKTIAKTYLSNRECSVQEVVYHILPKLKIRRIFLTVYFVNTNLTEERVQVLLSEKELMIAQIFSRNQVLIIMWKDQM